MTVHNSTVYKVGKIVLKDGPEVIKVMNRAIAELTKYTGLRQVRIVIAQLAQAKRELVETLQVATKVVKTKGKVNE